MMMSQIEENDLGFTGLWSNAKQMECGMLFLNQKLPNDIFFNKLSNVTCLSDDMIDKALEYFHQVNSTPYFYSVNYPEFEKLLEKRGFVHYDTLHALQKNMLENGKTKAIKITSSSIDLWTDVFCKAYDCIDWIGTVKEIVANSLHSIDYFVDESTSSCVALYEKGSVLGLYCLGTMPGKRNHGLASLLIDFALNQVKSKNLESLILETYQKDNLLEFYSKLGFEQVYLKKIYTI